MRSAAFNRKTKETDISAKLVLDGSGIANIDSGIGFFDHMLNTLAKHGGFDIDFKCVGDLNVDNHHTVEDSGIVLGECFNKALSSKDGIRRYQSFTMCMDDALVLCSVDLCGRPYFDSNAKFDCPICGDFETETTNEFFKAFSDNAKINLHFVVLRGNNAHHIIEAMFKSLAKCLRDAIEIDPRLKGSLSTKGVI